MNDFEHMNYNDNKNKMDEKIGLVENKSPSLKEQLSSKLLKLLASKKFLTIAILFTIDFIITILMLINDLNFQNFLGSIIPFIILYGVWKIYINAKKPKKYEQTQGLKVIKGVFTFEVVILMILGIILFIMACFVPPLFIIVIVAGAILYFYNLFRKLIIDTIESIDYGFTNTSHHLACAFLLIIFSILTIILLIISDMIYDLGMINTNFRELIEVYEKNFEIIFIRSIIQTIFSFHLVNMILQAKHIIEFTKDNNV